MGYPASIAGWFLTAIGRGQNGRPMYLPPVDEKFEGTQYQCSVDSDGMGLRCQIWRDENIRIGIDHRHRQVEAKANDAIMRMSQIKQGIRTAEKQMAGLPKEEIKRQAAHMEAMKVELATQEGLVNDLVEQRTGLALALAEWNGYEDRQFPFEMIDGFVFNVDQGESSKEPVPLETAFDMIQAQVLTNPYWHSRVRALFKGKMTSERQMSVEEIGDECLRIFAGPDAFNLKSKLLSILPDELFEEDDTNADLRIPDAQPAASLQPDPGGFDVPVPEGGPDTWGEADFAPFGESPGPEGEPVETNPVAFSDEHSESETREPEPLGQRVDPLLSQSDGSPRRKRKVKRRSASKRGV